MTLTLTRDEIMKTAKPILFNTGMTKAILSGTKTQTRRVLKPHQRYLMSDPSEVGCPKHEYMLLDNKGFVCRKCGWGVTPLTGGLHIKPKYQIGDIVYVRETWTTDPYGADLKAIANGTMPVYYKADYTASECRDMFDSVWEPSIFMPKEAARIFLRITDVRCQRIQDISELDAVSEGAYPAVWHCNSALPGDPMSKPTYRNGFANLWDDIYAKPEPVQETVNGKKVITHYVSYSWTEMQDVWEYKGKPWHIIGNPYVAAYSFERIEAE